MTCCSSLTIARHDLSVALGLIYGRGWIGLDDQHSASGHDLGAQRHHCAAPPPTAAAATRPQHRTSGRCSPRPQALLARMPPPFPAAPSPLCRRGHAGRATNHRPARRTTTPPAPAAHRPRPARPPRAAAPTPIPHETAVRSRRAATPTATAHPDPCPNPPTTASARPVSELEAQQESQPHRAESRNLWTTRAGNTSLWTACGTPRFRSTPDSGKYYFSHILLRRGHSRAQLT
jgi:hypothetical protein